MRLVYLDEGGTDFKAPVLTVAGVLVHGDSQWPEVDRRIRALIDKYIPEPDRLGFIFHATDIFHGSRYFDRQKPEWDSPAKRIPILNDLAKIIDDLQLPVVAGNYKKEKFGVGILKESDGPKLKGNLIHNSAVADCLIHSDRWLEKYAPSELATVIHEDGTPAKQLIKRVVRVLRSNNLLEAQELLPEDLTTLGLPLKRIIDTVHFAEKADARPLQLADLCAFIFARGLKGQDVPTGALNIAWKYLRWAYKSHSPPIKAGLA
jgi:hypothetical protein